MTKIGLNGVVNESLIRRFQGLASQGSSTAAKAAQKEGSDSATSLQLGLRTGAQTFAKAVQGLNTAISFFNAAKDTLTKLSDITDDLIVLADSASKSTASKQQQLEADAEFQTLANKFQKIVADSKLGERQFLNVDDMADFLKVIGLDKETSSTVADIFKQFTVPEGDKELASETPQAERPIKIPAAAYSATSRVTVDYEKIFDEEVTLTSRPNAYRVKSDLEALKEQITKNKEGAEKGVEIIGKNLDLVRAAGFAFLNLADQIDTVKTAEDVANKVKAQIRQDAPGALSQAENLNSLIVAALTFTADDLGFS